MIDERGLASFVGRLVDIDGLERDLVRTGIVVERTTSLDGSLVLTLLEPVEAAALAPLVTTLVGAEVAVPGPLAAVAPRLVALEVVAGAEPSLVLVLDWDGWTIVPDIAEVASPTLRFRAARHELTSPAGEPTRLWTVAAEASGTIELFGLSADARIEVPALDVEARLVVPDVGLPLKELLARLHLDGSPLDDAVITEGHAEFRSTDRWLALGVGLAVPASPQLPVALTSATLHLGHRLGAGGGLSAELAAVVELDLAPEPLRLGLGAHRTGPGAGWRLAGEALLPEGTRLGQLASSLSEAVGGPSFDPPIDLALESVGVMIDTHSRAFRGDARGTVELTETVSLPIEAHLDVSRRPDGAPSRAFQASIEVPVGDGEPLRLAAAATTASGTTLLGASCSPPSGRELGIGDLLNALVGVDPELRNGLNAVALSVQRIGILVAKSGGGGNATRYVFHAEVDGGIDLSALPLVGSRLPDDARISVELGPTYASGALSEEEADAAAALGDELADLLTAARPPGRASAAPPASRLDVAVALVIGDSRIRFDPSELGGAGAPDDDVAQALLPARTTARPARSPSAEPPPAPAETGPSDVTWVPVQRRLGPLSVRRVGVAFDLTGQQITVLVEGSFGLGGLEISADGLGVRYDLVHRTPEFLLDGLGLSFTRGPVSLTGTFLKLAPGSFVGEARIEAATWTLGALGAYAEVDGAASAFVYGFLNASLGGPVFFFVEGLSFGFGYNRRLIVPDVTEIDRFAFVAEVMGDPPPAVEAGTAGQATLVQKMHDLAEHVRPESGQHFLAAGIRFSSFRIVECVALLAVSFGNELAIDLLGTARIAHPPDPAPVKAAFVELNFHVAVHPADGFVGVDAALSARSYVLDPSCHLSGGAALHAWYAGPHEGDFVLTVGGYHASHPVPAHYPRPARLRLTWKHSDALFVEGSLYFAITPDVAMAGGRLDAHFRHGSLRADFHLAVDFLMRWQPFWFEGRVAVQIHGEFDPGRFFPTIRATVGASVDVWGPGRGPGSHRLSGRAEVELGPKTVEIEFGEPPHDVPSLDWAAFEQTFLGAAPVTARPAAGVCRELPLGDASDEHAKQYLLQPDEFVLSVDTVVPVRELAGESARTTHDADVLVPAMGHARLTTSSLEVTISPVGPGTPFLVEPTSRSYPSGMWSAADRSDRLQALPGGVTVTPNPPTPGRGTRPIHRSALRYEVEDELFVTAVDPGAPTTIERPTGVDLADALRSTESARHRLFAAFGVDDPHLGFDATRVAASLSDGRASR